MYEATPQATLHLVDDLPRIDVPGRVLIVLAPADDGAAADTREPIELVPAASMSRNRLQAVYTRPPSNRQTNRVTEARPGRVASCAREGRPPAESRVVLIGVVIRRVR